MQYWPVFAFAFSLFLGSIGIAIGATMWLSGKLSEQDTKRTDVRDAIIKELRETKHGLYGRIEQQYVILEERFEEKMADVTAELKDLSIRITRLEK